MVHRGAVAVTPRGAGRNTQQLGVGSSWWRTRDAGNKARWRDARAGCHIGSRTEDQQHQAPFIAFQISTSTMVMV